MNTSSRQELDALSEEFELDKESILRDTLAELEFKLSEEATVKIIKTVFDDEESKEALWEMFYEKNAWRK